MLHVFGKPRITHPDGRVVSVKSLRHTAFLLYLALRDQPQDWLARDLLLSFIPSSVGNPLETLNLWIFRAKEYALEIGFPLDVNDNFVRWVIPCEVQDFRRAYADGDFEIVLKFREKPLLGFHNQFVHFQQLELSVEELQRQQTHAILKVAKQALSNNRFIEALEVLKIGLTIDPQHTDFVFGALQATSALGQPNQGLEIFEKYLQLQKSDDLDVPLNIAQAAARLRRGESLLELRHNHLALPKQGVFIGRVGELERLDVFFQDERIQIVTLKAIGGQGKSSLALHYAWYIQNAYLHGVVWVDLSQSDNIYNLYKSMIQSLGLGLTISTENQKAIAKQIKDYLSSKHLLLVLDNADTCQGLEAWLEELTHDAPKLHVLLTTRAQLIFKPKLRVKEARMSLEGLSLIEAQELLEQANIQLEANQLEAFAKLHNIFAGLPIALSILVKMLADTTCSALLERIGQQSHRLESNLKTLLDRSLALLEPRLGDGYLELAVLRGNFSVATAMRITGLGLSDLNHLVQRSLLQLEHSGRHKWHPVLRDFAEQSLKNNKRWARQQQRHAEYFGEISHAISQEQLQDLDHNEDIEDLHAAWQWWLTQPPQSYFVSLGQAAYQCEHYTVATTLLTLGLNCFMVDTQKASGLNTLAWIDRIKNPNQALERWNNALQACDANQTQLLGEIYCGLGLTQLERGDASSLGHLMKSRDLLTDHPNSSSLARTLRALTRWYTDRERDLNRAERYAEETVAILEQNGDLSGAARALTNLAIVQYMGERLEAAEATYARSSAHYFELGIQRFVHGYALNQGGLARVAQLKNQHDLAITRFTDALEPFKQIGDHASICNVYLNRSQSYLVLQNRSLAIQDLRQALGAAERYGTAQRCNDVLQNIAEFLNNEPDKAISISQFVLRHPATDHSTKERATTLLQNQSSDSVLDLDAHTPQVVCALASQWLTTVQ